MGRVWKGATTAWSSSNVNHVSIELTTPRISTHCGTESSSGVATPLDSHPTLSTPRFKFRPFMRTDIGHLASLAVEHRGADATVGIPHPYTAEFARMWISSHSAAWAGRQPLLWAALRSGEDRIAGYAGLNKIDIERRHAELRFWVGCDVERKRDAVDWSATIVKFALTDLNLNRISAGILSRGLFSRPSVCGARASCASGSIKRDSSRMLFVGQSRGVIRSS